MMEYRDVKNKFGATLAKQLKDEKKALELGKSDSDPVVHWMLHPDLKGEAG